MDMEQVVTGDDIKQLLESLAKIPEMGTAGIISAILLSLVTVGIWIWAKNIQVKAVNLKNSADKTKAQAETQTENEEISKEWDAAHNAVEDERKSGVEGTKPRPKQPD